MRPQLSYKSQIFKRSKILLPKVPSRNSGGFTLATGVHSIVFGIQFPAATACCKDRPGITHLYGPLPPSFDIHGPKDKAFARLCYHLRVKVKLRSPFRHGPMAETTLRFMPLDSNFPLTLLRPHHSSTRHSIKASPTSVRDAENVTPQTLGIAFVTALPSLLIAPDSALQLRLFIKTVSNLHGIISSLTLRNLDISMHTLSSIKIRSGTYVWSSKQDIISTGGLTQPMIFEVYDGELIHEVDATLWEGVVIPAQMPSSTTCCVEQQHCLKIIAGISAFSNSAIVVRDVRKLPFHHPLSLI